MSRAREFADLAGSADAGGITGRNLIINGAMQVHQRGNQSVSSGNAYSLDRWEVATTGGSAQYDLQQSTDVPTGQGFAKSFKLDATTADAAMGAGDGYIFRQSFEGQNLQNLKKGTSNAEQVTVQFWVKSTKTGTYILEMYDTDNTRQVSKSYTVSSSDTWEYKTITFPADTSGTLDDDNARSLILQWWLAAGSNYTSGTLNTTWSSVTAANRVVGQVNALDSASNNFLVTGVQLEVGSSVTDFEHEDAGTTLSKCQRYYWQVAGTSLLVGQGFYYSSSEVDCIVNFPQTMRATPTFTPSNNSGDFGFMNNSDNFDTWTAQQFFDGSRVNVYITSGVSGTAGYSGYIRMLNSTSKIQFDAEL
jgi:hypothetical protein